MRPYSCGSDCFSNEAVMNISPGSKRRTLLIGFEREPAVAIQMVWPHIDNAQPTTFRSLDSKVNSCVIRQAGRCLHKATSSSPCNRQNLNAIIPSALGNSIYSLYAICFLAVYRKAQLPRFGRVLTCVASQRL